MEPENRDYKGHRIETRVRTSGLRTFGAELKHESEFELIIDDMELSPFGGHFFHRVERVSTCKSALQFIAI